MPFMLGFPPWDSWQETQHKGQRYIFFEKRQKPATNPAPFSNEAKTRPCRERITIFAFFAFSSRSLRVFFAFFFAHGLFYWIFHSSIRRVAETKLTPILKSLREAAAKGLASPFSSICCKASSALVSPRPENGEDGIIFPLVKKPDNVAKYVRRIKAKAGIEKDFTYHSSRHSAATLAITADAELYSVSKILGHGSIASTQVYAKVNMEKKVEAMSLTDGMF